MLCSLVEEDLHLIQATVRARTKRQRTDQRVVQKGGLISAVDGRLKVSQVQKEAEKAGRAAARAVKKQVKEDATQRAEA